MLPLYLGSQRSVTERECPPKYEPTGERMTNSVAWLAGPRPRVASVPVMMMVMMMMILMMMMMMMMISVPIMVGRM